MKKRLSKLQKFILSEAFKTWSKEQQNVQILNSMITGLTSPAAAPISQVAHVTRNHILINYFGLSLRKWRYQGAVQDQDTNQLDRAAVGYGRWHQANVSFYRAARRLKERGLLIGLGQGRWQLTTEGLLVLLACSKLSATV